MGFGPSHGGVDLRWAPEGFGCNVSEALGSVGSRASGDGGGPAVPGNE